MDTHIKIGNGIVVNGYPQPKKKKTDNSRYDIYLLFNVSQNGINQFSSTISTGISVATKDWKFKEMLGRSENARTINERLTEHLNTAKEHLELLKVKGAKTCSEVNNEILSTIKTKISGKAPKGKKEEYTSSVKQNSIESVKLSYFAKKDAPCKERQRIYERALNLLKEYYGGETPLITDIHNSDLEAFDKWYDTNYFKTGRHNVNTRTTHFSMIAAIFLHAFKKLKILGYNPLPDGFRGSFVDADREILSDTDVDKIYALDDNNLTHTLLVSRYCLQLQLLTGMGYGDLKSLTSDHRKFDEDLHRWIIRKNRNKTNVEFLICQSAMCLLGYEKLRELCGGMETEFKLPGIDYMNRQYKKIAKLAGVEVNLTTYVLRHSFAIDYMDGGGTLENLQKMFGHKDLRTTQIYGKISSKRINDAIMMLELKSPRHQFNIQAPNEDPNNQNLNNTENEKPGNRFNTMDNGRRNDAAA